MCCKTHVNELCHFQSYIFKNYFLKKMNELQSKSFGENSGIAESNEAHVSLDVPLVKLLFENLAQSKDKSAEDLFLIAKSHIECNDEFGKESEILKVGTEILTLFIQKNWTGPDFTLKSDYLQTLESKVKLETLKILKIDGENVYSNVQYPELLLISQLILKFVYINFKDSKEAKVWFLRSLFIHQQILEELSTELYETIIKIIDEIKSHLQSEEKSNLIALYLEFAAIFLHYGHVQKSKEEIKFAENISSLSLSLSGALGRRTKFQNQNIPQLVLKIEKQNDEELELSEIKFPSSPLPQDVKLEDDVRLDKVKYADNFEADYGAISGLQQAVILANLFQMQKSQPKDNLADEELKPLIACILEQPKAWAVRFTTLLLRSKLEVNHKRTVERALMQVQVLADSFNDSKTSFVEKFTYFFISYLPPKWEVQSTLANILVSMGSVKTALQLFMDLQEWEKVIYCYNTLQLRHKAKEIIEQELEKNESPKLWCLLGDATDDISCYEKAWTLSKERSARAQRHWAYFYYYRKNYSESIKHFQKSLEINSLQKELWYRLGYAALVEEKWEISATAYRRYCVLDPECFEAWNNLARCYCELKQKQRAWRALQEALKIDYFNWKVWDNYMVVSADLKIFDEVVKAYHELLNLKEKHLDVSVLNALILGLKSMEDINCSNSEKVEVKKNFKNKLLELFGRLTSQITNSGELWFLYSEAVDTDTPQNLFKKQQLLLKAHRSFVNKSDWEKNIEVCNKITYTLSNLLEVCLLMGKPDVLLSCKLAVEPAVTKIKKQYPDFDICEKLEKNLEKLKLALEE